jgi:hypothetical protein
VWVTIVVILALGEMICESCFSRRQSLLSIAFAWSGFISISRGLLQVRVISDLLLDSEGSQEEAFLPPVWPPSLVACRLLPPLLSSPSSTSPQQWQHGRNRASFTHATHVLESRWSIR